MSTADHIQSMVAEFERKELWGSLEFEFRSGRLVFIRRKETYPQPNEKNSVGPKGSNGSHDRDFSAV